MNLKAAGAAASGNWMRILAALIAVAITLGGPSSARAGARLAAADDNIPGVAIPASPVAGTLDDASDTDDVYAISLAPGDMLTVSIDGPASAIFDLFLFAPGASDISTDTAAASATSVTLPNTFSYAVSTGGTYYIDAFAALGSGAYTLHYSVVTMANTNIPGTALPASPVTGVLYEHGVADNVYRVTLAAGQKLTASIAGASGSAFDLYLYPPGSTDIATTAPITGAIDGAYPRNLVYAVPPGAGGSYYLDAYAFSGGGAYTIDWSIASAEADDNIPGVALPASPVAGSLAAASDAHDVYRVQLTAGQTLSAQLSAPAGATYKMFLLPANASDVYTANYLATASGATSPTSLSYTAPPAGGGTYFLDIDRSVGKGNYTLTWAISQRSAVGAWWRRLE